MKRSILLVVGFLFAISILSLLAEQSNISEPNYPAIESRLLALEGRLDALEQRVAQLEKPRRPVPALPTDPNKDALRIERLNKQILEAEDAIELIDKQIEALPAVETTEISPQKLEDALENANKKWRLLADQERNFLKIIQLAERYPDLEVNVMAAKKDLIECRGHKKETDLEKQRLREMIRDSKKDIGTGTETGTEHHDVVVP